MPQLRCQSRGHCPECVLKLLAHHYYRVDPQIIRRTIDTPSRDLKAAARRQDHPDLRGHQPDPARSHGPPAAQVARSSAFPLVSDHLLERPVAVWLARAAGLRRANGSALCPLFPVGSRSFRTWCWIRADPWGRRTARVPASGRAVRSRQIGSGDRIYDVARYGLADAVGSDDLQQAGGVLGGMGIGSWRRQPRAERALTAVR